MKKLLALLGVIALGVTATGTVVACGPTGEIVKDYGLTVDTINVLSKIINDQEKTDIAAGHISKAWNYSELFGLDGKKEATEFWSSHLFSKLEAGLKAIKDGDKPKYSDEEIAVQIQNTSKYLQDGLHLVYVNAPDKELYAGGDQQIITRFMSKDEIIRDGKEKTLEYIIFDEVNKQLVKEKKEPIDIPDLIASVYPRASLGFSFSDKGNVKLVADAAKHFWTFTF